MASVSDIKVASGEQERALAALGLAWNDAEDEANNDDGERQLIDGVDLDDKLAQFQDHDLVKDAILRGVDLRLYAKDIEEELQAVEDLHIVDYVNNSQLFAELHSEIQNCDGILARMEELLTGFHTELGTIGTEIQALQEQSDSWSTRHKNRAAVQQQLNGVLDGMVVSPELIRKIADADVGEGYIGSIGDLDRKIAYLKSQQSKPVRAFRDLGPELERLRLKAAEKIRAFFSERMKMLRANNANLSILQQNSFLKFTELFWFLIDRHQDAAADLRLAYISIVENYYYSLFEKYLKSTSKLQIPAGKPEFLGQDEAKKSSGLFSSISGSSKPAKERTNIYSLGDRIHVLSNPDPGIIVTHIAEATHQHFAYEAVFKSLNRLLVDNASSEYVFIAEFFQSPRLRLVQAKSANGAVVAAMTFVGVFGSTLELLLASTKSFVDSTQDALAVLLAIRLNQQHQFIMQRRQVPCLESYFNAINMLLWPRFQTIMESHAESVRKAASSQLVGNNKEVHPHYITRRYAEFASSILSLNQGYDDPLVLASLARIRTEVDALLVKMSADFADRRNKLIFMINNYDLVLLILNEHPTSAFDNEKSIFQEALSTKVVDYVEEELRPHFGQLISFVTKFESILNAQDEAKDEELARSNGKSLEEIAANFNRTWKTVLASINTTVIHAFPNFQNGSRILQALFTRLVVYYQSFTELWQRRFGPNKAGTSPVNLQTVLMELKRYRSVFT